MAIRAELAVVLLSLAVGLFPLLSNGAPMVGDSWVHMGIAKNIASTGRYSMDSYNTFWPLVNMLLACMMIVPSLPSQAVMAIVPMLVGLSSLPLLLAARSISRSSRAYLLAPVFLFTCLLFSFVVFAGSIMKETAAYYLTVLLIYLLSRYGLPKVATVLVGMGIVLGHHYAGLFSSLLLLSCLLLCRRRMSVGIVAVPIVVSYAAWNYWAYSSIGQFFPAFSIQGIQILALIFAGVAGLTWLVGWPTLVALSSLSIVLGVWGLRGGLLTVLHREPPISLWEAKNYAIYALLPAGGLVKGNRGPVSALAVSTISLLLFPFVWGRGYDSLVLLTKSLHYFALLAAISGVILVMNLPRRYRAAITAVIVVILLYESSYSGLLAMRGLSAYRSWEVQDMASLSRIMMPFHISSDTRLGYLATYYGAVHGGPLLISKVNVEEGFLLGYDWVPLSSVLGRTSSRDRLYDSSLLMLWGR